MFSIIKIKLIIIVPKMQSPNQMLCVYMDSKDAEPQVKRIPIPSITSAQVLVKVDYAPINPSDLKFMKGNYYTEKTFPCVPGFEGAGTVVLTGGGVLTWGLSGKKVAFYTDHVFGSYAEYAVVDAKYIIELEEDVPTKQAACAFINPLTVIGMLEVCKELGAKAVVHNPGASQVGQMMHRYFSANGVRTISIVRRSEQAKILESEGNQLVLVETDADFEKKLQLMIDTSQATIYFDAVGGEQTGKILSMMPPRSKVFVYGTLSSTPSKGILSRDLIFSGKSVQGFWVTRWLREQNMIKQALVVRKVKQLMTTQLGTKISKQFRLEQFAEAVEYYKNHMSEGKVLVGTKHDQILLQESSESNEKGEEDRDNLQQEGGLKQQVDPDEAELQEPQTQFGQELIQEHEQK